MSLRKDIPGGAPFASLLVANRGEIALRIIRASRELGIESIAVFSAADRDAPHVRAADRAVAIGGAAALESYLNLDAVMAAARATGAQALHPGYGFLSEQATLAEACAAAGITFVGPAPTTLAQLGDKLAARARAKGAGVPVVPGTFEPADPSGDTQQLLAEAERIGFPLMVKAAAGGGGRGMRRVEAPGALADALASASREAAAAFGDGSVYLERYVEHARHVEVQLLGDEQGNVVALGERDCSVQRRHQKLVEEAPAPGLDEARRRRLHELGVAVARTVGLRNAATAEFLLTPGGDFWFLEVNARLQVEHGVTELVTGLDLVHEQLRLAAGQPLSAAVLEAAATAHLPIRHAIEVRLSAEDPAHGFAPAPGEISHWRMPAGPGVRIDAGVEQGSVVSPDYDPLLAKVLVVARDRPAALARLARALDEVEVGGVQTTLPFDRWLLSRPEFAGASDLSTDLVARLWDPAPLVTAAGLRAAELAAAASSDGAVALPATATPAEGGGVEAATQDGVTPRLGGAWWRAGISEATAQR